MSLPTQMTIPGSRLAILLDGEYVKKVLGRRLKHYMAVRRGTLVHQGGEIGNAAVRQLTAGTKTTVDANDVIPKIVQKGVDMRIGLDIASLALKRLVSAIVVVSGDSDLVPAMKLARREGLRVFLDSLGNRRIRPELKKHADRVL